MDTVIDAEPQQLEWTEMTSSSAADLYGVWGSGPEDVFAVGSGGAILHYDGAEWEGQDSGVTVRLHAVWGSSSSNVYAVGGVGSILHYDGSEWSPVVSGTTDTLQSISGSAHDNIYAVSGTGTILHYAGPSGWNDATPATTTPLSAVWINSDGSDGMAVGREALTGDRIYRLVAGVWTERPVPATPYLNALSGSSISDLYTVGAYNTVMRYDSEGWVSVPLPSGKTWHLYGVWRASSGLLVAVGRTVPEDDENILIHDGRSWAAVASGSPRPLNAAWGSGPSDIFVVGERGRILHYGPEE